MKSIYVPVLAACIGLAPLHAAAQVAGKTTLGAAVAEVDLVATGWSAKKQILGRQVINDVQQKVGRVDDIIIAPDRSVSYVIIGAGGFVGVGRHDVAIPVDQIEAQDGKILLRGATKDAIKALPAFEYAKK
jgi:sporulation protein YlmC with PRC-barrel domain